MMKLQAKHAGISFRERIESNKILPLIGVYDVFSACLAAKHFDGVFCSGFGFSASCYGIPDIGFANWRDMLDYASRIRHVLPESHILVDIDDGLGDAIVAANTVHALENNGISAVMLEDQQRPRRCGHSEGKRILPIGEYLIKLNHALKSRDELFVIARTDAVIPEEGMDRAVAYAEAGADGVMVEAIDDLEVIRQLRQEVQCPIMVNRLHDGRSPNWTLPEMEEAGVSIVIYSAPCLFAAQYGIERYLADLVRGRGKLPESGTVDVDACRMVLAEGMEAAWFRP
uniref:Carboxyvinyl-carboxyphosphonate phosphorylmutase n=1 Tax=Candidatus Kentrum sp. LFY TaxID=2126342 RepID=A0A450W8L0_9GAMM|nr:MAG: carboxyvinyl-carboxyphosphonate phosphorylmutase [Candidatus Kentron sp. LFY]